MTEIWWVVRLRGTDDRGRPYYVYLRCANSHQVRNRRTRSGRKTPRKWRTSGWKNVAFPFDSLVDARRGARCRIVQTRLNRGYDMVEIVCCEGNRNRSNFKMTVVERPGVDALIQLAMEAE